MRAPRIIFCLLAIGASACADSTAPAAKTPAADIAVVGKVASIENSQESLASVFSDAGSRLTLSFAATAESANLRKSLLVAAASLRSGDMTAAAAAVIAANTALTAIDPDELNPDAVAIRLMLGYAGTAAPRLAIPKQ